MSPAASKRSRTNASIGFRTHAAFLGLGTAGRRSASNAQWFAHEAPALIHCWIRAVCSGDSGLPSGGIRSDSSCDRTRARIPLASTSPGTTARSPESNSAKAALRELSCKPPS